MVSAKVPKAICACTIARKSQRVPCTPRRLRGSAEGPSLPLRRAHEIPSAPVPAQLRLPRCLARRKAPRKYQNKRQARCVYSSPSRLFEPILRFRRYVFLLRSTISPGRGFTGSPPFSGLPPSLTRTHALLRFAVLALACKPAARRPWRARSAGQSLRLRIPCFARKTGARRPWCARSPGRGFTGSPPIIRLALGPAADAGLAVRGEPVQRVKRSLDLCLDPLHPSPAPYGPALRLHSGLGLTKEAKKTNLLAAS